MKILLGLIIAIALIAIGFFVFTSDREIVIEEEAVEEEMVEEETDPLNDEEVEENIVSFSVETVEGFRFSVEEMRVNVGDTVRVELTNVDEMPHDFIIDELDVATRIIENGESDIVEFVVSEAGTFEYYCSVGSHREMGMVGTLIVE